ncbi:MAG: hypothetical protein LBR55_03340 [Bacteroidales bacterium]|jgi:hypothetical protein|nr:hypothetical protein [Bacteroidales bacterium]
MKNNYINGNSNVREIKAETIVALQDLSDFSVQTKENGGAFYRNYSSDLIRYDSDTNTITLSRDGIYNLLPEGLFFEEDELRNSKNFKETRNKIKEKKKEISHFFQPFDTEYFKLSLALEKHINKCAEKGNEILLDLFFDNDNVAADVETWCAASFLLPQISQIKGNEHVIGGVLKTILHAPKVELIETDYCNKSFIIYISNLSKKEYFEKKQQVSDIFKILEEYVLPFDVNYDFKIKDREQKFILNENLILDYNTNLI